MKVTTDVSASFTWRTSPAGRVLVSERLAAVAPHLFSTRDLDFRGERQSADFSRVGQTLDCPAADVLRVKQVHGRTVVIASAADNWSYPPDADALVTTDSSRAISVRVADCVPILIADRDRRAVAAIHAGWRGTAAGIARAAVEAIERLGVSPAALIAAIGPSIGPCCYQVDEPVRSALLAQDSGNDVAMRDDGPGHWRLDMWEANVRQLVAAGVPEESIDVARYCTAHHLEDCHSYRAEGPGAGRLVAAIRLARGQKQAGAAGPATPART